MPFAFKGFAIAASGQITAPFNDRIEVIAATALPNTGGYGSAEAVDFNYRNLIRFKRAHSCVVGSTGPCCDGVETNTTLLQSTVEGLDVFGVLTADRITSRLMTSYSDHATEPTVQLVGTHFENLKIAGQYIKSELPIAALDRHPTYSAFTEARSKGSEEFASPSPIKIPGLGTIRLGEIRITPLTRIVNMLQIDFDCPWKGHFTCCLSEDGGSPS